MYATVLRPCAGKALFMLSLFEAPGSASPWESARAFRLGLPPGSRFAFKDALMLTREELDTLLETDAALLGDGHGAALFARRRLVRCARLFALALHALEDPRAAARWLKSPQPELGGSRPLLLARTQAGARTVERVLATRCA